MPIGPARMPFLKHLDELRKRMFVVAGVLVVGTVVAYFFTDPIYKFILAPVWSILKGGAPIAIGVLDPMTVRFGLSFWSAVVIASPLIIWEIMAFFLPALQPKERRLIIPTFAAMVVLFLAGCALCYTVVLPASFAWLASQAGSIMSFTPQAGDMLTVVEFFLLGFGVAFQTPVIVFYLVYFGVIPYRTLRDNWRTIYMVLLIAACLITPDWSPVSMGALAIALIFLYEASMLACRAMLARRIRQQAREAAEDEDADDADLDADEPED
jgi:sec-independent protein translocase protein TatC